MTPLLGYRIAGAFALAAVTAHSFNFVGIGAATLSSPYPLPWVVLVMVGIPIPLVSLAVGALFLVATRGVSEDRPRLSRGASLWFAATVAASAVWFVAGWRFGIGYQGRRHVLTCVGIGAVATLALLGLLAVNRSRPSPKSAVLFHFVLFCWLASYTFPYLGELP
jgi:hypothetical protein